MRRSTLVLTAVGISAAAVTGAAFTASNTLPTTTYAGYGSATVSGAVVTDVNYTPLAGDNSKLDGVIFTTTTHLNLAPATQTATMVLKSGASVVGAASRSCTINSDWDGTKMSISCPTADNPSFSAFDTVGLTVVD